MSALMDATTKADVAAQLATNLLAPIELSQLILPGMDEYLGPQDRFVSSSPRRPGLRSSSSS
jgi:NAD(P)-dependent dehydrogenase (short-subunit alcohol dehydrogenase family)